MSILSNLAQQIIMFCFSLTEAVGIPNWGLAIILMTIIVKIVLFPLTKKQIESTKAMMKLQPKMDAIRAKYKDDKARMNAELANLYKEEKVNPLSGCLPLLIQFPIMIGIFYGIRDMTAAHVFDQHPDFLIWNITVTPTEAAGGVIASSAFMIYMILPILSCITTFIASRQAMPGGGAQGGAQGKIMLYFMPLFILYISKDFPIGLIIYWTVMNIVQIGQQMLMDKMAAKGTNAKKA